MKIVACVRTRDEEKNIERFMESYQWVNKIIVSDSGSTDNTIEIASSYNNALVKKFYDRVVGDGYTRSPHGKHINSLIFEACRIGADWIIFDDCDCVPNYLLRLNGRDLLEGIKSDYATVFAYRMYVYGNDKWFPDMSVPGQSIWAWKPNAGIVASCADPLSHIIYNVPKFGEMLDFPYTLLHYFAPDEETIQKKMAFYDKYKPQKSLHPLEFCGNPEPLPEWARI